MKNRIQNTGGRRRSCATHPIFWISGSTTPMINSLLTKCTKSWFGWSRRWIRVNGIDNKLQIILLYSYTFITVQWTKGHPPTSIESWLSITTPSSNKSSRPSSTSSKIIKKSFKSASSSLSSSTSNSKKPCSPLLSLTMLWFRGWTTGSRKLQSVWHMMGWFRQPGAWRWHRTTLSLFWWRNMNQWR